MVGMRIHGKTNTNELKLNIPDDLKGIELQIIILPVTQSKDEQIEFFTEDELKKLSSVHLGNQLNESEDYSKMVAEIHLANIYFTDSFYY